jgi:hypothetical protein
MKEHKEKKKEYEAPELIVYGTVEELTQGTPYGGNDGDGGSIIG